MIAGVDIGPIGVALEGVFFNKVLYFSTGIEGYGYRSGHERGAFIFWTGVCFLSGLFGR